MRKSLPWKLREFRGPRSWIMVNERMWLAREPGKNDELPHAPRSPQKVVRRWRAVLARRSTVLARRSTDVVVCHLLLWKARLRPV